MKKMILFAATITLCGIMMTSCLGSNGNSQTGIEIGVLTLSDKGLPTPVLRTMSGGNITDLYAPEISGYISEGKMTLGGCYRFAFSINYDQPENAMSVVATNGYYVVALGEIEEVSRYTLRSDLTDTIVVWHDEIAVSNPIADFHFIPGYLFFIHTAKHQSDVSVEWDLSYNYSTMMPKEENGQRIYELYLRAAATKTSAQSSVTEMPHLVAYYVGSYIETAAYQEKNALGSNYDAQTSIFKLRIRYASEIKDDSIIWKDSNPLDCYISSFLKSE